MRGATDKIPDKMEGEQISIHAPHAGSDLCDGTNGTPDLHFNPRSPCGERRSSEADTISLFSFQSTLPMRGATDSGAPAERIYRFQSTLPMRGATGQETVDGLTLEISIHAPHAGSDQISLLSQQDAQDFNPRSPCGERPRANTHRKRASVFQSTLPMRGATQGG